EAPSSIGGVLPLANFGTVNFSNASATINGTTGAIDNPAWQNASINMVSKNGAVEAKTGALTDTATTPATSSFSVQYVAPATSKHHGHSWLRNKWYSPNAATPDAGNPDSQTLADAGP